MARPPLSSPTYRKHAGSGQAVTTVRLPGGGRKDVYLGPHDSPASRAEFRRVAAAVEAAGGVYPAGGSDLTAGELLVAYLKHARAFYRGPDETPGRGFEHARYALKKFRELYADAPAGEFGPKCLKVLVNAWVADGLARGTVNARAGAVKRMYKWAVSEELAPADAYARLTAVEGLRQGRTAAPDRPRVEPAREADVETAAGFLPPAVAALVRAMMYSGARCGELCSMTAGEVDRAGDAWTFRPASHKGTWKGKTRTVYFGPNARAVLAPLLAGLAPGDFVFSPARSEAARSAARGDARGTPKWASHMKRNAAKRPAVRAKPPGDRYTTAAVRRALERACDRAGVPRFSPHRLRHLAATRTRAAVGLEAARALLGHGVASMAAHYSNAVDRDLAAAAAAAVG